MKLIHIQLTTTVYVNFGIFPAEEAEMSPAMVEFMHRIHDLGTWGIHPGLGITYAVVLNLYQGFVCAVALSAGLPQYEDESKSKETKGFKYRPNERVKTFIL